MRIWCSLDVGVLARLDLSAAMMGCRLCCVGVVPCHAICVMCFM